MANPTQTSNPGPRSPKSTRKNELQRFADGRGPTPEQIARRAYEIYLARGGQHGHDREDWLQAERELTLGRY